jgi:hypothetical protein
MLFPQMSSHCPDPYLKKKIERKEQKKGSGGDAVPTNEQLLS